MSNIEIDIEMIVDTNGIDDERLASFGNQGYMVASVMWGVKKSTNKPIAVAVILQKPRESIASGSLVDDEC
tara:strand:+ start:1618 stop:1830 length:213 start_codon:yes stop_codon:yes gene_type:complete